MKKILYTVVLFMLSVAGYSCGSDNKETNDSVQSESGPDYSQHFDSMPSGGRRIKVKSIGPLGRVFNDSNYLHLAAARSLGIDPINTVSDVWHVKRPMVKVENSASYFVDELNFSLPYLVPEAEQLLDDIGRTFIDTLNARGGGFYRIKVTSLLRTPATVVKLRRRNRNATDSSAHLFGTTFDISYAKFICDSVSIPRTQEDLKNLLGEILADFRAQGRCYVKYERKQGCFHITTRPQNMPADE